MARDADAISMMPASRCSAALSTTSTLTPLNLRKRNRHQRKGRHNAPQSHVPNAATHNLGLLERSQQSEAEGWHGTPDSTFDASAVVCSPCGLLQRGPLWPARHFRSQPPFGRRATTGVEGDCCIRARRTPGISCKGCGDRGERRPCQLLRNELSREYRSCAPAAGPATGDCSVHRWRSTSDAPVLATEPAEATVRGRLDSGFGFATRRSSSKPLSCSFPQSGGHHAPDRASCGHGFSRYSEGA